MEVATINNIININNSLKERLSTIKKEIISQGHNLTENQFGSEGEYSINSILLGLNNLTLDISYLTKSQQVFVKLSTFAERNLITGHLQNIINQLNGFSFPSLCNSIDNLKILIRSYNLRSDKDRFVDYNTAIDEACRKKEILENEINNAREKIEELSKKIETANDLSNRINESHENINTKKEELLEIVVKLEDEAVTLKDIITSANTSNQAITNALNTAKSNEGLIKQFAENVASRELQLENQEQRTKEYSSHIDEYKRQQKELYKIAQQLIEEAKRALNYKSAEGLSAAFNLKLEESKSKSLIVGWLAGAGFFILLVFGLGIWIVVGWKIPNGGELFSLIGRITMIPIAFAAALFCANQYIKQKQIIEDYAYKSVLAKSIISFSEALKDCKGQEYTEYINTVLKEIHQDPLRKRTKDSVDGQQSINLVQQLVELLKTIKSN